MSAANETEKAEPKPRVFYLVYAQPERATVRLTLDPDRTVTFGRADADVVVDDPQVSRRHADIRRSHAAVLVRDLGSRNGTTVNGEALHGAERRVHEGDVVGVGPMTVLVVAASPTCVVADPAMRRLAAAVQRVARRRSPVLFLGEPGVGKAVFAQQLHDASSRSDKPFVRFDCDDTTFDAALLPGVLETAHRGTLFLAEVGELPRATQTELVRFQKARAATPDVRLLGSSSARDLAASLEPELHALVGTVSIALPPLRERMLEVPALAEHLLARVAQQLGVNAPSITPEAMALLSAHAWPRNLDDLHDVLDVALALSEDGRITAAELPPTITGRPVESAPAPEEASKRVVLRVLAGGESFQIGAGAAVSLARRGPLRRVLLHLATNRHAVPAAQLVSVGWPGERLLHSSAEGRLRTAIWALRRMGLHDLLVTRDDGYLLAPNVEIVRG